MEPWKSDLDEFFTLLMNRGACPDIHNAPRLTTCTCMVQLQATLTDDDRNVVLAYLVQYAKLEWPRQRHLILEWKKYAEATRLLLEGLRRSEQLQVFLLPGSSTHKICKNAMATILGKSKFAMENIGKEGKDVHGLAQRDTSNFALLKKRLKRCMSIFSL